MVYDVSSFLDEHPGGPDILLEYAGGHADDAFEDIGHTNYARAMMKNFEIGSLAITKKAPEKAKANPREMSTVFTEDEVAKVR